MESIAEIQPEAKHLRKSGDMEVISISIDLAEELIQLLETSTIHDLAVSSAGIVHGELKSKNFMAAVRVQLTQSGGVFADPSVDLKYSLTLALHFMRELMKKRIFEAAPLWLTDQYCLQIKIQGDAKHLVSRLEIENLERLQAYWALLDLAMQKKSALPPKDLARYVLKRFRNEKWKVQRAELWAPTGEAWRSHRLFGRWPFGAPTR